jgi:hypothetical protein
MRDKVDETNGFAFEVGAVLCNITYWFLQQTVLPWEVVSSSDYMRDKVDETNGFAFEVGAAECNSYIT